MVRRLERHVSRLGLAGGLVILVTLSDGLTVAQQTPSSTFGGGYASLDVRRQRLVDDWTVRFAKVTGQTLRPETLYDDVLSLSAKTTFEAVTHALMTTPLTDAAGASLGDALGLIEHVESVRGEVAGAPGDRQFRMYVRLVPGALDTLARSQQFRRGVDNSVYHKGYPINYRGQGGVPSMQVSVSLDRRRADIDVDYRSSGFPIGLFNGHLTSSNSDVRAGNNYDRHVNRWTGFQNWWRSFFGVRQERAPETVAATSPLALPSTPRAGKQDAQTMIHDFLTAWLIEGDIVAAMGYVSERAYACLARDLDDPSDFDRGLAPFQMLVELKAAYDALGPHTSLDQIVVGTRLAAPALRVVQQPHHAQFVVYEVPDDVAAAFDCGSALTLADPGTVRRRYGNHFGATFYIAGRRSHPVSLLWARENGYWKLVSWRVGGNDGEPVEEAPPAVAAAPRIAADPSLARAARGFLESWLERRDYDAAFGYLAPAAYACYDLERDPATPPAASLEEAGRRLRAELESAAGAIGGGRKLDALLSAADPIHPAVRVMDHPLARVFSLTSVPNALAEASECAARATGSTMPDPMPLEYGRGYGLALRFKTRSGDAPVLRLLWRQENGAWRITSYGVELP